MQDGPDPQTTSGTTPWWRRKLWKLPVWGWLAIGVVAVGAAAGSGGGSDDEVSPARSDVVVPSSTTPSTPAGTDAAESTTAPSSTVAPSTTDATADAIADDGGVPWEDYAPEVRTNIDALAAAADCAGLQEQFDTADANNDATMSRTGHNNADLMTYIDAALSAAGCYDD